MKMKGADMKQMRITANNAQTTSTVPASIISMSGPIPRLSTGAKSRSTAKIASCSAETWLFVCGLDSSYTVDTAPLCYKGCFSCD
jgi:hypothetical protein